MNTFLLSSYHFSLFKKSATVPLLSVFSIYWLTLGLHRYMGGNAVTQDMGKFCRADYLNGITKSTLEKFSVRRKEDEKTCFCSMFMSIQDQQNVFVRLFNVHEFEGPTKFV